MESFFSVLKQKLLCLDSKGRCTPVKGTGKWCNIHFRCYVNFGESKCEPEVLFSESQQDTMTRSMKPYGPQHFFDRS